MNNDNFHLDSEFTLTLNSKPTILEFLISDFLMSDFPNSQL